VLLAATKSASGLPTLWNVHEELAVIKSIVPSSAVLDVTHDDRENVDVGKDDDPIADATKDKLTDKERQEAMRKRDVRTRDRHHYGPDSTVDDILAHLPRADIVHLACHGMEDWRDPLHSGFRLADGMINVRKLMRLKLDKPLLAYLGACDTAKGLIMAEEAFHLCSAMLFTGFKSVVGTMWWVALANVSSVCF
jgi:CHAT domain-containing protein